MREDTIEICHLKKAYGEHVIFSNLTMELKKGAVTCLMAPSGAERQPCCGFWQAWSRRTAEKSGDWKP